MFYIYLIAAFLAGAAIMSLATMASETREAVKWLPVPESWVERRFVNKSNLSPRGAFGCQQDWGPAVTGEQDTKEAS